LPRHRFLPVRQDQVTVEWVGGAWDGRTLIIEKHTAFTLLGMVLRCPSQGAPFMVLSGVDVDAGPILSYQADDELSGDHVLYLRALTVAKVDQ